VDLVSGETGVVGESGFDGTKGAPSFPISATSGLGVDALIEALARHAGDVLGRGEAPLVTRERHRLLLTEAYAVLGHAVDSGPSSDEALIAEDLRAAAQVLGRVTGRVDVEDVLDVIFRDFCIGK
jgi:tRNA modification GTPase